MYRRLFSRRLLLSFVLVATLFRLLPLAKTEYTLETSFVSINTNYIKKCSYVVKLIEEGKHVPVEESTMDKCPYLLERWSSIEGNPTHTEFASGTPSTEPTEIHISRSTQSPIHMKLCPYISLLSAEKRARLSHSSPLQKTIFSFLFPGSPKVNSLLATFYISSIPNFILFFVPPDIQPPSLNTLVSFAVGGLLGDVFLHLLPQSFMGETSDDDVHFVMIDEKRNVVIGLGLFAGLACFFVIDKSMRILSGDGQHEHGHGHTHGHAHEHQSTVERKSVKETGESTAINKISNDAKRRNTSQSSDSTYDSTSSLSSSSPSSTSSSSSVPPSSSSPKSPSKQPSTSIRLSAYLNLIADATHNFTDGLAMAASFYASPSVGATTTVAVFFHEIPHEIGDYAILVQSGFTKRYALLSQFGTALGAFLGTFAGIAIEEYSRGDHPAGEKGFNIGDVGDGIWGTSVHMSDLVIPFTAGGFIYIATVGVIPELLEVSGKFGKDIKQGITEFVAMLIGIGMMAVIAWNED